MRRQPPPPIPAPRKLDPRGEQGIREVLGDDARRPR
jgi:hypothetical protein